MREITMQSFTNTGPVVNWLKLPESGERLLTLVSAINTPAVAAAFCIQPYAAKANDEISLQIGDLISVIDMSDKSMWWRGKRGLEVGFFPAKCVEVISERAPLLNLENLKNTLLRRKSLQRHQRHQNENKNPFLSALEYTEIGAGSGASTPSVIKHSSTSERLFKPMFDNRSSLSNAIAMTSSDFAHCSTSPTTPTTNNSHTDSPCDMNDSSSQSANNVSQKKGKLSNFFRSFIGRNANESELPETNNKRRMKSKSTGDQKKPNNKRQSDKKDHKSKDKFAFGNDLNDHLTLTNRSLPLVLTTCCEFLETNGIVHGIYRLSGLNSNIQKLIKCYNCDQTPDFSDDIFLQDVHCVASLLKLYFRELPNPLLTYELYEHFVKAIHPTYPNDSLSNANGIPEQTKLDNLVKVLQMLPLANYQTLKYLIRHLNKIASYSEQTGMTIKNLAIVWAPNLLRSRELETQGGIGALQCIAIQAVLTEYLIRFVDQLFTELSRPSSVAPSIQSDLQDNALDTFNEKQIDHEDNQSDIDSKHFASDLNSKHLRLITLKEARSRWERRRLIDLNGQDQSIQPVSDVNAESKHQSKSDCKDNQNQNHVEPVEHSKSKIVLRHPEAHKSKMALDDLVCSNQDQSFGVIGQYSSFRSKRNFGNLDLILDDANKKDSSNRDLTDNRHSVDNRSPRSPSGDFAFKNHSMEQRKYATLEPGVTRYHTILNPKHFRKNKVNPSRFGQIQMNFSNSRED